uniref:Uncharacterized protein ycf35 n=1 Tax=Sebdenia flabellata TaxID=42024 RepID=A0A1C9CA12_9FLOR|nr:hypothetical protein Sebd_133 [Sebdenia flabellata]AOM65220.1 hypothetical protein Sebd_133 [Sebdenia flabellata]
MSHFSRIKTSIKDFEILQKTLKDLNYKYTCGKNYLYDSNNNLQNVDLMIHNNQPNMLGFSWDGQEYNLVTDLQLWNEGMSIQRFMDKILQKYALNSILNVSVKEGFKEIKQKINKDGSIQLVIQRWN